MKKMKFLIVILCLMMFLTVSNVEALPYKESRLFEKEVITISSEDIVAKQQEQEENKRRMTIYIAMGVSIVSFIVFIGTTCALIKQTKGQKK